MIITFPSNTREIINAIRSGIGREITFYSELKVPCSACSIDPITDTSTNSYCTVCGGIGYIITLSGYSTLAHITHGQLDTLDWQTGGKIFLGDARVQIEFTQSNYEAISNAIYLVVDGKNFTIKNKTLRGVPEIDRILLDLIKK